MERNVADAPGLPAQNPSQCSEEDYDCLRASSSNLQPSSTIQSSSVAVVGITQTSALGSTTANPAKQTPTSSGNNGGLSKGAVAGIALAMLAVGAAIALILAFFLFKKRGRRRNANAGRGEYTKYAESLPELVVAREKSLASERRTNSYFQVSQVQPSAPPPPLLLPNAAQHPTASDAANFLPPAASRDEIHQRVSSLYSQIRRHVEIFYRNVNASITPSVEPELAKFGNKDVDMAKLLQDCSRPTAVLEHALSAYVLGITGPKKEQDGQTLFPEELSKLQSQHGAVLVSDPVLTKATSLHRRVSVYLYTSVHAVSSLRASWSLQSNIREAAELFSLTFFPWANPLSSDQEKEGDLAKILVEALSMQIWLLGQPSRYEFVWERTHEGNVVVSPSLVQEREGQGNDGDVIIEGTVAGV